ncbi:MAG TPA: tRNA lysidine(34) synthetase TilS C-terminal domain-containing protein, partial [Planctomycetota bacterium]|nr:tRNA lysidine(34) synthetase TilS C-terminal domain-containing protein [Planctomycetota bacterium]
TADALEESTSEVWQRALGSDDVLLDGIRGLDATHRRQVWRRLVLHLGMPLDRAVLERLDELASGAPGRRMHLGRWLLLRRGNSVSWELARPLRQELQIEISGPGEYLCGSEQIACTVLPRPADIMFDADEGWLDAARCVWPLVWRPAGVDERFTPLGAPGRQTVVKFLSTRGVPSRLRPGASVVADAHGVVWVPGFTIAERVKLRETTTDVVHLRWSTTCATDAPPTVPPLQPFQDDTDERS